MVRELPIIFGQKDYLQTLGFSPTATIATKGCFLDSFANVARYYGKTTDPVDLNSQFKKRNIYVGLDELTDDALTKIYPDIVYQESLLYPDIPADLPKLKTLMDDPTLSVILEIDMGGGNTHFVLCVGVNGIVTIANPWDKAQEDFATLYGDPVKNIIKYIVYKGTPVSVDQQVLDQLRQQRDANWNLHLEDIEVIKNKDDQLSGQQAQTATVTKKSNEQANEIITLNSTIQTMAGSNKNYAGEALAAEQQEGQLRDYLYAFADRARLKTFKKTDKDLAEEILAQYDVLEAELNNKNKQINKLSESIPQKIIDSIMHPSWWQTVKSWIWQSKPS